MENVQHIHGVISQVRMRVSLSWPGDAARQVIVRRLIAKKGADGAERMAGKPDARSRQP